ncbi:MAG: hypothetical protein EOP47_27345, partial [Sphingobacteriaceae bacterium]
MIKKISRKQFLLDFPEIPQSNYKTDEYTFPQVYDSYILTLSSKSARGHAKLLGVELSKLMANLNINNLSFLGDTRLPWLYQDNDYSPVKQALQYLSVNKVSKSFNGALNVDLNSLPEFIIHFFWLIRCNAALPYFNFTDTSFNIVGSICQYGNVHLSILNEETDEVFEKALLQTKFVVFDDNSCY